MDVLVKGDAGLGASVCCLWVCFVEFHSLPQGV